MEHRETDLWFCFISEEASEQPWGYTTGNRVNNSTQVRSHIRTPALQVSRHHCSQHCQPWCWTMDPAARPVVSAAPDTWTTHCHLHRVCHSIQPSSSLCVTMSWLRVQHVVTCLVEPQALSNCRNVWKQGFLSYGGRWSLSTTKIVKCGGGGLVY